MQEKSREVTLKAKYKADSILKKGPIIDSAATVPILTEADSKKCNTITELKTPQRLDTIDGVTKANKTGNIQLQSPLLN